MTFVLGRGAGLDAGPAGRIGRYRALDGSAGAPLYLDLDGPHAGLVVGKRGYGKSYTLGVLAEELARVDGTAAVVVDPMGVFATLADSGSSELVPAAVESEPIVGPGAVDPRSWPSMLGLSPESGAGSLVWRAAAERDSLDGMVEYVRERARAWTGTDSDTDQGTEPDADDATGAVGDPTRAGTAPEEHVRAAVNHLRLAHSWNVFGPDGLDASDLTGPGVVVLDLSGYEESAMNAVVRGVADELYRARVAESVDRLPWLLVDEAHAFFDGVARSGLERILTRGRAPGMSVVLATQRPGVVPSVAVSQTDLLFAHRLTAEADIEALERARPTYVDSTIAERLPNETGAVAILDDGTETTHAARIRERTTPHGGDAPRVSET